MLIWAASASPGLADPAGHPSTPAPAAREQARTLDQLPPVPAATVNRFSGRTERGKASYYAGRFADRTMADGRKFNPSANVAASKTLPLGTTAKVVNLATGKSAMVKVEDKGPYVAGRVMDVSPKVADDLGMTKSGVAPVAVKPVAVPLPDGQVKLGAGAADMPQHEVSEAVRATKQLAPDRR